VGVTEGVRVGVPLPVPVGVALALAVPVGVALALAVVEAVSDTLGVWLGVAEPLGVSDCEPGKGPARSGGAGSRAPASVCSTAPVAAAPGALPPPPKVAA
jgi:hypothetical protein